MSTCTTPGCGNHRSEHLYVCQGEDSCEQRLQTVLDELPHWYHEVELTFSRQDAIGGDGGRKSAETSLPHKPKAGDALALIAEEVNGWALHFAEAVGQATVIDLPSITGTVRLSYPPVNPGRWLQRNVYTIVGNPRAGEALAALEGLRGLAMRVVDRPEEKLYAGACPVEGCLGILWARPDSAFVRCQVCRVSHPVAERRQRMIDAAAVLNVSKSVALEWVRILMDRSIPDGTWGSWRSRGRLHLVGVSAEGLELFRFGDVRDLAINWMARKKAA
jgi:hypothetical protein